MEQVKQADGVRINVYAEHEVLYWMKVFGVTESMLRQAVNAVGTLVKDVERYLAK